MKKLASLLVVLTAFVMIGLVGKANAVSLGFYEKGLLVPVTVHDHAQNDTVVGMICSDYSIIYWTLFDKRSHHVADGSIPCTKNDLVLWSLNQNVSTNIDGYLVFTANGGSGGLHGSPSSELADDNKTIAGNAFLIDAANDDAVYVPAIPLSLEDYDHLGIDLATMNPDSVESLSNGFVRDEDCYVDLRFWFDPEFEACTHVTIWTTACLNEDWKEENLPNDDCFFDAPPASWDFIREGEQALYCPVQVYNADERRSSLSIPLYCEVTQFVPATDSYGGQWPGYNDGFIRLPKDYLMPEAGDGAFAFSWVTANKGLKAAQTLMPAEAFCGERQEESRPDNGQCGWCE